MPNAFDVDTRKLIVKVSSKLKGELAKPDWVGRTKSGSHAERLPADEDFWYARCASLLWQAYSRGVIGVNRLRTHYGGVKNRGAKPSKHRKSGGSIIRKGFQALEKVGYLKKEKVGRSLTAKGRKLLDNSANELAKAVGS